jgi:hypothetical protein
MKKGKLLNRSEKFCSSDLFKQRIDLSLLSPLHVPYQEEGQLPHCGKIRATQHRTQEGPQR